MEKDVLNRLTEETVYEADKLNKLNAFMKTDKFIRLPREKKDLLYEQQRVMSRFVQILGRRVELENAKEEIIGKIKQ